MPSSEADLEGLTISSGTLSPEFSPEVTEYTVELPPDINEVSITPVGAVPGQTIYVDGNVVSGSSITVDVTTRTTDAGDLAYVASRFGSNDLTADVNGDGKVDNADINQIVNSMKKEGSVGEDE